MQLVVVIEVAYVEDPFYAVYKDMYHNPDILKPVWEKARRVLYEYSGVLINKI